MRTTPAVRLGALLYAAATFFSFLVPNPLGGNAPRLAASIGVPLLACFLTAPGPALARLSPARLVSRLTGGRALELGPRWRAAAVALVVPFAVWQWAPERIDRHLTVDRPRTAPELLPAPRSRSWPPWRRAPSGSRCRPRSSTGRPPSWLPHVSLARGWERQLDVANNPIFYTDGRPHPDLLQELAGRQRHHLGGAALGPARLRRPWARPACSPSGQVPGLQLVWQTPQWRLWRVDGSPGLVSGAGHPRPPWSPTT